MLDVLLSDIGLLSLFTLVFIFSFFGYLIYKLNILSKQPPAPPLVKTDD
ncbi:MAG: hypothetical protein KAG28_08715 [Cocleimonas sp.]|nr:hypothetical protein [Cocleimonas sp.]